jgi:hypothetical protein
MQDAVRIEEAVRDLQGAATESLLAQGEAQAYQLAEGVEPLRFQRELLRHGTS